MKIIVANYHYFVTGGPEVYMFKIMKRLEEDGHTVIPFSTLNDKNVETSYSRYFAKNRDGKNEARIENIKLTPKSIFRLLSGAFYNFDARKKLLRLIKDTKPDVLYVLQEVNSLSPSIFNIPKKYKVKIVYRISDFNMMCPRFDFLCKNEVCTKCLSKKYRFAIKNKCVHNSLPMTLVRVWSMRFHNLFKLYKKIDQYVVPSNFTKKKLIAFNGSLENRINLIPTFIDFEKIVPSYSFGDYILFSGRLSEEKGVKYLIEAILKSKKQGIETKLLVTGDYNTDYGQSIIEFVKLNNLYNNISFLGFCDRQKIERLLSGCSFVVCPSIWFDNMPNSIIEAFAFGKPVVASRLGSMEEMIKHEYNGLLFEAKNSDDLATCIVRLYRNKEKTILMGKNARAFCEKNYNPTTHMNKLYSVFEKV